MPTDKLLRLYQGPVTMNKIVQNSILNPIRLFLGIVGFLSVLGAGPAIAKRNTAVLGCWGDAKKGDAVDLKTRFVGNGSIVQYDENQVEKAKRTFGAWEMEDDSTFLSIYWPDGRISQYAMKRIGPILHFSGQRGVRNFTLREITPDNCWEPRG
jgi:hypothetical protein